MSLSLIVRRLRRGLDALSPGSRTQEASISGPSIHRVGIPGRSAVMANITATGVISSVAIGSSFDYTIQLANSSASNSGIGTFWYSWVPAGEDFLATSPISVNAPAGWTETITHGGPSNGYAIQFVASSSADDVQPGSSLNFSFVSPDSPASINGNSVDYPGTPVGTAFVYPGAPLSDGGHEFVVTPASTQTPSPTSTPLVSVTGVQVVRNKKHLVTGITVDFSGAVNASEADSEATYRLATAGKKGSFAAKNAVGPQAEVGEVRCYDRRRDADAEEGLRPHEAGRPRCQRRVSPGQLRPIDRRRQRQSTRQQLRDHFPPRSAGDPHPRTYPQPVSRLLEIEESTVSRPISESGYIRFFAP